MTVTKKRLIYFSIFLAITASLIVLHYAPLYLAYADTPVTSDAVVLFLGSDSKARQEDANRLMGEGYARYLFIPALGKIVDTRAGATATDTKRANPKVIISGLKPKPYFENTHVEVLEAKRMMEKHNLTSAIFVSSPVHMRRIKIITEKIFERDLLKVVFVPIRGESVPQGLLDMTLSDYKRVGKEYVKIVWFLMYSPFRPI